MPIIFQLHNSELVSHSSVGGEVVAQVVAHRTMDPEALWVLFSSLSYQKCVLNKVPHGGTALLILLSKILGCAALNETSFYEGELLDSRITR